MKMFHKAIAVSTLGLVLSGGVAIAQDHDNHHYVRHDEWKKGYHLRQEDWARGEHIEYRQYHLHAPPRGYEWRLIDGNYVLANSSTGVVSMTVVAR
jgi:Ni/Co efflux regulator RcnB